MYSMNISHLSHNIKVPFLLGLTYDSRYFHYFYIMHLIIIGYHFQSVIYLKNNWSIFFFISYFNVCRRKNKILLFYVIFAITCYPCIPCFLLVETNKYMQYKGNVMKKNYFASLVLPIFENTMQQIWLYYCLMCEVSIFPNSMHRKVGTCIRLSNC